MTEIVRPIVPRAELEAVAYAVAAKLDIDLATISYSIGGH